MLDCIEHANNDGHVEPLYIGSEFIWRELFLVGDVEVEVPRHRMRHLLDVVYLL